ncbi:hypothetical protein JCM10207_000826 [Rhodosporidiobolus poonsookiae]
MSTCSFASYLSMRTGRASSGSAAVASTGPVAAFHHPAPALSPLDCSDAGSPHKRQRNTSPDHSAPSSASTLRPETSSYFAFAASSSSSSTTIVAPIPSHSSAASTPSGLRSILCTPSSPESPCTSPFTSPPSSRPLSRRSSTSKSVRFARCTNASVFPTHSTIDYDRSPIIPTCEAQSLELKRQEDDDDGGWVQCHVREKQAAAADGEPSAAKRCGPQLPKYSPAMENPVEGVHGLIEGGFFVGEERDLPSAAAADAASVIPEDDEELEFEDDHMVVDDSTESASDEAHLAPVPRLVRTGSLSDDSSATDSDELPTSSASSLPDPLEPRSRRGSGSSDGDDSAEEKERKKQECRKRFGLCALGKWSRSEVFASHDSLGGF